MTIKIPELLSKFNKQKGVWKTHVSDTPFKTTYVQGVQGWYIYSWWKVVLMTTMRIVRQNFVSGAYYAQMRGKGGGGRWSEQKTGKQINGKNHHHHQRHPQDPPIKPYLKKTICSPSETPQKDRDIWR